MRVRIVRDTVHGNPGERRVLPAGALAVVVPADNVPAGGPVQFWAAPIGGKGSGWPDETAAWAADVGVGLVREDFDPIGLPDPFHYIGRACTLDGRPAKVVRSGMFAAVAPLDVAHGSVEFSWSAVFAVFADDGGRFKS